MVMINLTKHPININGVVIPPHKKNRAARLKNLERIRVFKVDGFDVAIYKHPENMRLPAYKEGINYIVSRTVAFNNMDRKDLFFPDTSINSAVKMPDGTIYMVTNLSTVCKEYTYDEKM